MSLDGLKKWIAGGGGKEPISEYIPMQSGSAVDDDAEHNGEIDHLPQPTGDDAQGGAIDWESKAQRALQRLASGGTVENFDHTHELFANSLRELGLMLGSSSA